MLPRSSLALIAVCILGQSGVLLQPVLNYYKDFLSPLASTSFVKHFGVSLTADSGAEIWLWSLIGATEFFGRLLADVSLWWLFVSVGPRDLSLIAKSCLYASAAVLLFLSAPLHSVECLIASRFALGVASRFTKTDAFFLGGGLAPDHRGRANLLTSFTLWTWKIAAAFLALNALFGSAELWSFYALLPLLPIFFVVLSAPFFPNPPQWLLLTKGRVDEAKKSIRFYDLATEDSMSEVLYEIEKERESTVNEMTLMDVGTICAKTEFRLPFITSLVMAFAGAICGDKIANLYSVTLLEINGFSRNNALMMIIGFQLCAAAFSFSVSKSLIERIGRRRCALSISAVYLLAISSLILGSAIEQTLFSAILGVFGLFLIMISQGSSLGSLTRLYICEMCPTVIRGRCLMTVFVLSDVVAIILLLFWPSLYHSIGFGSYFPLLTGQLFCFCWLYRYLPETRGKTVVEIVAEMMRRTPSDVDLPIRERASVCSSNRQRSRSRTFSIVDAFAFRNSLCDNVDIDDYEHDERYPKGVFR